ncbi:uncharacterized protein DS421_17g599390 [Arachis hypogaea]|nr:uncharacterized protein DS421_17g599390 [Arachis hypogaea]
MSSDDSEDNEPLDKRMRRLFHQGVVQQKTSSKTSDGNLNQKITPHETTDSRVPDVGTLSVALVQHQEWKFDGEERVVVSYEGRLHLELLREDLCTLQPRHWINSNIVQWMYFSFNDSESSWFKDDFYCIPPGILETVLQKRNLDSFREISTLSYVGLGPHFGADSRYLDKVLQKRLWVLDSMHSGEHNDERSKIDAYAGRIIEDVAKVSMPAYEPTENGLTRFYASVPKQPNQCDCGVYVIKFMQYWSLDKPLQFWTKNVLQEFRKEIKIDIVMGPHNSLIGEALEALDDHPICCNQPRNKTKAVRLSFTAPSTKTML